MFTDLAAARKTPWTPSPSAPVSSSSPLPLIIKTHGSPADSGEEQQRLVVCDHGGNWSFNITSPGPYTYILGVDREGGDSLHAEQQFTVDS